MKYKKLIELKGKTLEYGDNVEIANIIYKTEKDHMENLDSCGNNGLIFKVLGITDPDKFCSDVYGYKIPTGCGLFSYYRENDYTAATKIMISLMEIAEGQGYNGSGEYTTAKQMKGEILKYGDKVTMLNNVYKVQLCEGFYLYNPYGDNDEIFQKLRIEKYKFCKKYYNCSGGRFPEQEKLDRKSFTKAILALMRLSEINTVQNALDECSCVKRDPRTANLKEKAEKLEDLLKGKSPDDLLSEGTLQMTRDLFNLAEDEIIKK